MPFYEYQCKSCGHELECLTSQLTKQNRRGQPSTDADRSHPYRASGLVHRPYADLRHRLLSGLLYLS
jgi:predicted nucleic acid-binding Zn ribbon protein